MTLAEPRTVPVFPPLMRGEPAAPGQEPVAQAIARASLGTDPGLIVWRADADRVEAALVLAPEEPLARAMGAVFAVSLGFGDALGALAPPEVAVHFEWPGTIRVNGARAAWVTARASTADPEAEPDWLIAGLSVALLPPDPDAPGATPEATGLYAEGCAEVGSVELLEAWARHTLSWLNRLSGEGFEPLHRDWRARAWRMGEALPGGEGVFVGLDEAGGQLVKAEGSTRLRPLTEILGEGAP